MEGRAPYAVFNAGITQERTGKPLGRKGGDESSVGPDLGEASCRVNVVLIHPNVDSQSQALHVLATGGSRFDGSLS